MKLINVLVLLLAFTNLSAQKVYIKFLTNSGVVKDRIEDADFIREYTHYNNEIVGIKEYYKNRSIKMIGQAFLVENNIMLTGDAMYYDINKNKVELAKFNKGIKYYSNLYYKNGKLKKIIKYDYLASKDYEPNSISAEIQKIPNAYFNLRPQLTYYADSLGKVMIEDGNGIVNEENDYLGEVFIEKGNYKNGYKEGNWQGINKDETKQFNEKYRKGNLVSGTMEYNSNTYKYNFFYTRPIYGLGNNHVLDAYLEKTNFKKSYTNSSIKLQEFTFATVLIGENGKVEKVTPCICSEKQYLWLQPKLTEALFNMPTWKPATLRGLNVKAKYTSSISIYSSEYSAKTQTP